MNKDDKAYTEGIQVKSKFAKWFDNYWYHYKWITIGVVFLLAVLLICTVQLGEKQSEDVTVLYAGPYKLGDSEAAAIQGVFNAVMPEDFDGNGKKHTGLIEYLIYSEEQIKEIEAETDEYGASVDINNQHITNNYENYYDYVMIGETSICLLDPSLYRALSGYGRLLPIATALGEDSGFESDVNGVYLSETKLYEEYSALRVLPEDTVICFLRQTVTKKDSAYQNEIDMLRAILTYSKDGE